MNLPLPSPLRRGAGGEVFDDNYVPYDFGYDQIGAAGQEPSAGDLMHRTARVTRPGYIYIYLSNENQVVQEVYFDDFSVKLVKAPAVQNSEYYPFGLQTSASWMKENSTVNKYSITVKNFKTSSG